MENFGRLALVGGACAGSAVCYVMCSAKEVVPPIMLHAY